MHAVFEARVLPPPLPPAEEGATAAEAGEEVEERLVQFTRTWRETPLHASPRFGTLPCTSLRCNPAASMKPCS